MSALTDIVFGSWKPEYCKVCGKKLIIVVDPDGYWEDNGEPRFYRWLKCPDWTGGRTMYIPNAAITYTALAFNRKQNGFTGHFGYTRYQTCDETIIY